MGESVARLGTMVFAGTIILITLLIVYSLTTQSWLAFSKFGFNFFATRKWDPVAEQFGALPFIYGTLVTSFVALLIAVPLTGCVVGVPEVVLFDAVM